MSSRLRLFLIPASRLTGASTHTERTVNAPDTSLGKGFREPVWTNTNGRTAEAAGRSHRKGA